MGTASSMSIMAEALGMTITGLAGIPAPDSRLLEGAHESGRLAVELVQQGTTISSVVTRASFNNAIVTLAAIGGSTNAVVHLLAIAGRLGIDVSLQDFDRVGTGVPLLVNLQPAGAYLMEDLFRAGGPLAVLAQISDLLDSTAITVTGGSLVDALAHHRVGRGCHHSAGEAAAGGRQHRGTAREPCSPRRHRQACGGEPRAAGAPRTGSGVRLR
jgi:dihydroxy-acid dehydratase